MIGKVNKSHLGHDYLSHSSTASSHKSTTRSGQVHFFEVPISAQRNFSELNNHHRSRVETTMHCEKLLVQRLSERDFDRQVAERQVRIAVLNGCTALDIRITETLG